jgi:WD40 repeat protein
MYSQQKYEDILKYFFLYLSFGQDFTVTLWDVLSSMCLVVFHGPNGHTDQVLCVVREIV